MAASDTNLVLDRLVKIDGWLLKGMKIKDAAAKLKMNVKSIRRMVQVIMDYGVEVAQVKGVWTSKKAVFAVNAAKKSIPQKGRLKLSGAPKGALFKYDADNYFLEIHDPVAGSHTLARLYPMDAAGLDREDVGNALVSALNS